MPRSLVVGNGNLLINFDIKKYNIRDIYYPYVGMENHAADCVSRTGVWRWESWCHLGLTSPLPPSDDNFRHFNNREDGRGQ